MNQDQEKYLAHSRYAADEPQRYAEKKPSRSPIFFLLLLLGIIVIGIAGLFIYRNYILPGSSGASTVNVETESLLSESITEAPAIETETEKAEPVTDFSPHAVASTHPDNMIEYTELEVNGSISSTLSSPTWYQMDFDIGSEYSTVDGIITFRGNNFRDSASYGTAFIANHTIDTMWQQQTGALTYNGSTWSGSGWTGQPLIMKWPRAVKQQMNMYPSAQSDDDMIEVIYACMDGYIYFLNLVTGQATRDPLYIGYTFKGSGSLDPRGYPIMYVGAGYDSTNGRARVFVISLIDGSILYTFGNDDSFSLRGNLSYFDSSPLVDADSDTLIYPGENGLLYLMHLNTVYDTENGTISVDPDQIIKWRYNGLRTSASSFWLGMEDSCAVYKGYLYIADNGGHLMCLNLNTMELVWVQDILDDSNSTPVLSIENNKLYVYVSTSFRQGWRASQTADIPIWKIDAETGEIIWQTVYECYTQDGVSGGVQSTIAVGKEQLSDRIFVTVSMVGDTYSGMLTCLDKETGDIKWEHASAYAWSSPVCIYSPDGDSEILYADASGNLYLVNADTGETYYKIAISDGVIEASPAVYRNYVVVGTRASKIWGLQLG